MKKFLKFIFGTATVAAAGAGAYYAYKKFIEKANLEEEEDFEEDIDEFELDEEDPPKAPEYVSINPKTEENSAEDSESEKEESLEDEEAKEPLE